MKRILFFNCGQADRELHTDYFKEGYAAYCEMITTSSMEEVRRYAPQDLDLLILDHPSPPQIAQLVHLVTYEALPVILTRSNLTSKTYRDVDYPNIYLVDIMELKDLVIELMDFPTPDELLKESERTD